MENDVDWLWENMLMQGRFEILYLFGSFMVSNVAGQRSRIGGLSVALSGSDGRVLGGTVVGVLIAASPVQVYIRFSPFPINSEIISNLEVAIQIPWTTCVSFDDQITIG